MTSLASPPVAVRRRARRENFPVALRVLPRSLRAELAVAYAVARTIDEAGDDPARAPADRLAHLDTLDGEVSASPYADCYRDLIEANRRDQTQLRYSSYADLLDYCRLSADPVGRIVLRIFAASSPTADALSGRICTALQILEHCQDVAEDKRDRGRIYLPLDDLAVFGVDETELDLAVTSRALRELVAFEVDRAAVLLAAGEPLVRELRGWARVAVAGYVAGGCATVDAMRRADHDVLRVTPRPRRRDVLRHFLRLVT